MSKIPDHTFGQFLKSLGGADWDELNVQKQGLIALAVFLENARLHDWKKIVDGLIHFIDALQDDAADVAKIWQFPPDPDTEDKTDA